MDQPKIGSFLQALRKEKQLTQEQLAEKLNVSRRTVSRWETGSNLPDLDLLIELADYYEVELRELLDGERKSEPMNRELQETVTKVAEYSGAEKTRAARITRIYFILGILALVVNGTMNALEVQGGFWIGFVKGITFGLALGAMALGILYTTGAMGRIQAAKLRLLRRGGEGR